MRGKVGENLSLRGGGGGGGGGDGKLIGSGDVADIGGGGEKGSGVKGGRGAESASYSFVYLALIALFFTLLACAIFQTWSVHKTIIIGDKEHNKNRDISGKNIGNSKNVAKTILAGENDGINKEQNRFNPIS